ncbi:LysR substrate-binding domain-containing protein [Trinickia sp.]|uniref:LysR substrate-binding domain-containing protein n=1 Tax=Trinickia sp. TaxID=2571163 RepID=UPI003F7FB080
MPTAISVHNLPLSALRAFEAAARLGSFKAAAAELFVTPAAISQQIVALETYVGAALFDRLNRAVRLTPTGAALAKEVSGAFAQLQTALMAAAPVRVQERNTLVISAVPSFASRWLAPRLDTFHRRHPYIEVQLLVSEALVDLAADGRVDLALRYGPGPYREWEAQRLAFADLVVPVCSPSVRAKLPAELSQAGGAVPAPLVRVTLPPSAAGGRPSPSPSPSPSPNSAPNASSGRPDNVWTAWLAATGLTSPEWGAAAESGPLYSVMHLAIEAAIAGRGIALAPFALVADDLAAGRLERIGTAQVPDANAFWLLIRKARGDKPAVRAFADWLCGEVASARRPLDRDFD